MSVQQIMLGQNISAGSGDITTGLQAWWKYDDGSGSTAADSSGNGSTGVLSGASPPTWNGFGMVGTNSLNFGTGGVGYVASSFNAFLNPTALTLSCWIRISSLPNSYNAIYSTVDPTGGYHQILVKSNGTMAVYLKAGGASVNYDGTGSITLSTSTWYFICATYSSATGLACRINNSLDATVSASGTLDSTTVADTSVGYDLQTSGRQFNGDIDDVRLYNRVLTTTDQTTLYAYR